MAGRRNKAADDWRMGFLEAFLRERTVTEACRQVGISRSVAYHERDANPAFRQAWEDVEEETTQWLEREALRRAAEGWVERERWEVDANGKRVKVESTRKFDGSLLQFMLRARRPDVYRENLQVEHSGAVGHAVGVTLLDHGQPIQIPGEARRAAAQLLLEAAAEEVGVTDAEVVE